MTDLLASLDQPTLIALALGGALILLILVLLMVTAARAGHASRMVVPLAQHLDQLGQRVQSLSDGQERLAGGLTHVSEAQAASQTNMLRLMETRLTEVSMRMNDNLEQADAWRLR